MQGALNCAWPQNKLQQLLICPMEELKVSVLCVARWQRRCAEDLKTERLYPVGVVTPVYSKSSVTQWDTV